MIESKKYANDKTVMLRRGVTVRANYPAKSLVSSIKKGWLKESDEISLDGKRWQALKLNPDLRRYFEKAAGYQFPDPEGLAEPSAKRVSKELETTSNNDGALGSEGNVDMNSRETVNCPYCGTPASMELTLCPNCLKTLRAREASDKPLKNQRKARSPINPMRLGIWSLAFLLLGVLIYFYPHFTLYQLSSSLENNDLDKLPRYIDFERVRQNLKDQVHLAIARQTETPLEDKAFADFNAGMNRALVERAIDGLVSPGGLMALASGKQATAIDPKKYAQKKLNPPQKETMPSGGLFKEAESAYQSASVFTVTVKSSTMDAGSTLFIFVRNGIIWKLVEIRLDMKNLETLPLSWGKISGAGYEGVHIVSEAGQANSLKGNLNRSNLNFVSTHSRVPDRPAG